MRTLIALCLSLVAAAPAALAQLAWTQLAPIISPVARTGHKLASHPTRQRMVLFGGRSGSGILLDDTWEFDGTTWQQIPQSIRPTPRAFHTLVYDPTRDALVLFGGHNVITLNDTWIYSAQGRWSRLQTAGTPPPPRAGHVAFVTRNSDSVFVFGGGDRATTYSDQYALDSAGVWHRALATAPPRAFAGLAYDVDRDAAVMTGGTVNGNLLADTWQHVAGRWVQVSPDNNLAVAGIDLVYDPIRQRTVYFGGITAASPFTATHAEFAAGTWSLFGIARPPARADAAMAFDPRLGKVLMFGGASATGPLGDTWALGSRLDAQVTLFGPPCGTVPPVLDTLLPGARPWIGSTFDLRLTNLPSRSAVALFLGASATSWQGLPLPLSLDALGLPACRVHVSFDVQVDLRLNQTEAIATLPIPATIALNGALCFAQGLALDGRGLPEGLRLSNAAQLRMGLR